MCKNINMCFLFIFTEIKKSVNKCKKVYILTKKATFSPNRGFFLKKISKNLKYTNFGIKKPIKIYDIALVFMGNFNLKKKN